MPVLILITNDFYFKYRFHNELTGKLSDFAGLFAFPYFLSTIFKRRIKSIYFFTSFLFIWWKTGYSQFLINLANEYGLLVHRTVDYIDLIALIILPVSYLYWKSNGSIQFSSKRLFRPIIISICCFTFIATTLKRKSEDYNLKSDFKIDTEMNFDSAIMKLDLIKSDSLEGFYYPIRFPEKDADILTKISFTKNQHGNLEIKLDSIINYSIPNKGNLFWTKYVKKDAQYFEGLTQKEVEKFFSDQIKYELRKR